MYFVKLFGSGLDKNRRDPRDKVWAEFHCSLCGKNTDIHVTRVLDTFDFKRERRCSHCGQISSEDAKINLKAQIDKLTIDKSRIEVEIEKLTSELESLEDSSVKEK